MGQVPPTPPPPPPGRRLSEVRDFQPIRDSFYCITEECKATKALLLSRLSGKSKMYSSSIALRRNLLHRKQNLKPLVVVWRSQKTQAITPESSEDLADSAKVHDVRPFEDIPGPKLGLKVMVDFYGRTEGFTKVYKLNDILFGEYGPIYQQNMIFGMPAVHVIDPEDFKKVFRAEGKYPRRPPVDVWNEYRKRRNLTTGVFLS